MPAGPHRRRMNALDRLASRWLRGRGYIPEPGRMTLGYGAPLDGDAPVDYLAYARTSNPVYACIQIRARMLAGLPIVVYTASGGGDRAVDLSRPHVRMGMATRTRRGRSVASEASADVVTSGPVIDLLATVADGWTWRQLVYMTEWSLCLTGQSTWVIDRGPTGEGIPTAIYYVRHGRLTMVRGVDGIAGWTLDRGRQTERRLRPGEVLWLRYPDPADPDFGVLSPLAAARLGADSYTAAMRANKAIFDNGIMTAGLVVPPADVDMYTPEQMDQLAGSIDRRFRGADKAHKLAALPYRVDIVQPNLTPHDAEFQALLDFSLEDVARAYGIPIEFIGGARRTYQNLGDAQVGIWTQTIEPEAVWLAEELTERFLPMFGDVAPDWLAFDLSGVSALQEDETAEWERARDQIASGVITGNEWRLSQGLDPLETVGASIEVGKVGAILAALQSMGQGLVAPESVRALITGAIGLPPEVAAAIVGNGPPPMPEPEPATVEDLSAPPMAASARRDADPVTRVVPEYDSAEHRAIMARADDATRDAERAFERVLARLFERQADSIIARLTASDGRTARLGPSDLAELFERARWVREFRKAAREGLEGVAVRGGRDVWADLDIASKLDPRLPALIRFIIARSQRFAERVNDTTWDMLRASLLEGIKAGEGVGTPGTKDSLAARVQTVMQDRIRSSAETIARTEVVGAYTGGGLVYVRELEQSTNRRYNKTWLTSLDERVRDSHRAMHGVSVGIDDEFRVGDSSGPAPGQIDAAEETINCRCRLIYERSTGRAIRARRQSIARV